MLGGHKHKFSSFPRPRIVVSGFWAKNKKNSKTTFRKKTERKAKRLGQSWLESILASASPLTIPKGIVRELSQYTHAPRRGEAPHHFPKLHE
jgi:hypothetical protein